MPSVRTLFAATRKIALGALLLALFLVQPAAASASQLSDVDRILVINAYHRGFRWTDSITAGIESVLETGPDSIRRQVEYVYMDTKRLNSPDYIAKLRDVYQLKFQPGEFDVIIASDNNALDFLVDYRDAIFGATPVVFCGINDYEPGLLRGASGYTGVNERPDFKGGIDLILRLQPRLQRLFIIEDDTPTGRRTHGQLLPLLALYQGQLQIQTLKQIAMADLEALAGSLDPERDALLYTTFFRDSTGRYFEYDESINRISRASRAPVYATWDFSLGFGTVGGRLTDGFSQGEAAARMALRVLAGESPQDIPVLMDSPSRYMFDYRELRRFDLPLAELPRDSVIIHQPDRKSRSLLWAAAGVIALLVVLVGLVLLLYRRRLQAERQAWRSQQRLEAIYNNGLVGIALVDIQGRYLHMNPIWAQMVGIDPQIYRTRALTDEAPENEREQRRQTYRQIIEGALPRFQQELKFLRTDGTTFWGDHSVTPLPNQQGRTSAAICVTVDTTERHRAEEEIRQLAYYDSLTQLPNRSLLADRIAHALLWARRENQLLGLLYLDLDRFKTINDTHGHGTGDALLCLVAQRLRDCVRQTDTVARLGGDEFVVLLERVEGREDVGRIIGKILNALREPFVLDALEIQTSTSIGAALFPYDGSTADLLLKHADMALYAAKEQGRNTSQYFSSALQQASLARHQRELELRRALNHNELFLVYQPQYDLKTGQLVGVEALLRWRHPTQGILLPGEFLPLAEESGLIRAMDEWVLRQACRQAKSWDTQGLNIHRLCINLSQLQLTQPDLVDNLAQLLAETELSPRLLELELTETLFMHGTRNLIDTLADLKMLGVGLAIDDFGTGYSSLNYLRNFPVDRIKIDCGFVRDLLTDTDNAVIVDTIINMANTLHLTLIAEGVETEAQLHYLRQRGCFQAQGFLLGHPMAPSQLAQHLLQPPAVLTRHHREAALPCPAAAET